MARDARTEQEIAAQRRAQVLGMPYIDTSQIDNKRLYKEILSTENVKRLKVIPLTADTHSIHFGVTNTTSRKTMDNLVSHFLDQKVTFSIISDAGYREYVLLYDPPQKIEYQDINITPNTDTRSMSMISQTLAQVRPDDMLAYLVKQAFQLGGSDIHLESSATGARIRFRVDGVLHPIAQLDQQRYHQFISVLASAANISTATDEPQTGQINRAYTMATGEEVTVNLRVEAVPAIRGTDAVLRLFNFSSDMLRLDKLGLSPHQDGIIRDIINRPSGLVMMVGPTGSGKTTTLYSMLSELNTDDRKIITLEDPVEYQIEGITQIPIDTHHGGSFAEGLRSVLRLDPDVIMVGEIRDTDTAKTALQAALTGHLVLTTYHANSAAAAITRLVDAIGENPLYASAIRLIQAQRLVRRLDDDTKVKVEPSVELEKHLEKIIHDMQADVDLSFLSNAKLYQSGKSEQNPFGFTGQFAIRELLTMSPEMVSLLTRPSREVTSEMIEETAVRNGMLTMKQDGVLRALKGDTTYEEIFRVLG